MEWECVLSVCCRLLVTVVFGAVSLSGTRRSATISVPLEKNRLCDLLVAHASDCHLFNGEEFLGGAEHSRCEHACKLSFF